LEHRQDKERIVNGAIHVHGDDIDERDFVQHVEHEISDELKIVDAEQDDIDIAERRRPEQDAVKEREEKPRKAVTMKEKTKKDDSTPSGKKKRKGVPEEEAERSLKKGKLNAQDADEISMRSTKSKKSKLRSGWGARVDEDDAFSFEDVDNGTARKTTTVRPLEDDDFFV